MREIVHILAGWCGNHMGTAIWKVLCDENGFGGDGEHSGDNDAQLDLINVFYHWAYRPRAACTYLARISSTSNPV